MTRQELADELQIKDSYLRARWSYIQKAYGERGIRLEKRGRGATADYGISYYSRPMIWHREVRE